MQLDESYEIFELTQHDGVVVSKARDKKTGKLIQIHLFPNEKIPEASQICARLLSLPGEARSKVLKYGQDGSSTYFITEPLPEGEGLAEWVRGQAAPRPEARLPEVSSSTMGNVRRMDIEPAPLQPLSTGQAQSPNPPPVARSGPIVRPIPATTGPNEPSVRETGNFTRLYSRQELKTPPQAAPSQPPSPAPLPSSAGFTQIYGMQDWKFPEQASNPETVPEAPRTTSGPGAGLETFIGIPKAMRPPAVPPPVAPLEPATPTAPQAAPVRPASAALPLPASERFPPPPRGTRPEAETFTFDAPLLQTPNRQEAESYSYPPPPSTAQAPATQQSALRQPAATPEARRVSAPLFSGMVAIAAAMGLMVLAAIVVLAVEFL